jgi:3-oxoacyl-[acyl-carrier protein] reductase
MKLQGKVAIITGGSSGIGRATAKLFAQEGAKVAIACRGQERGRTVLDEISAMGAEAMLVQTDVSRSSDVARMVESVRARFGEIHILVNDAGVGAKGEAINLEEEEWERVLNTNLKGCFLCCREVARRMIAQGKGGKIVNISSIHAKLSGPRGSAYSASKGGMESFSRSLATELAPYKINVNVVAPGATHTAMTEKAYTEQVTKAILQRISLKEIAQPEWVAPGILFLSSDDARYITGQVLTIDGGFTMDGSLWGGIRQ